MIKRNWLQARPLNEGSTMTVFLVVWAVGAVVVWWAVERLLREVPNV